MEGFWNTFGPWVISAVGGAIGAVLLLPSKLGEMLFKYRFDKEIEGFKADQGAKLEKLREQLGHLGDRGRRSNELEFAAIREVWDKTVEAHLATANCIASFVEYPDLTRLSPEELDGFLPPPVFLRSSVIRFVTLPIIMICMLRLSLGASSLLQPLRFSMQGYFCESSEYSCLKIFGLSLRG